MIDEALCFGTLPRISAYSQSLATRTLATHPSAGQFSEASYSSPRKKDLMVALIVAESGVSEKNFLCRLKRWKRGGMQCIHSAALGTRTTGEIVER